MKFLNNIPATLLCVATLSIHAPVAIAQTNINRLQTDAQLLHGIQQYEDGHFVQAIHSLEDYLGDNPLSMVYDKNITAPHLDKQKALHYLILSKIKYGTDDMEKVAQVYIDNVVNTVYRDRVCYQLAKYYFYKNDFESTIKYYEMIDMNNLNNNEIAELKFELAYSYFVNSDFDKAYKLFSAIKEIEDGPYYYPGNYYYGLIAYNKKQYNQALTSFKRIEDLPEYASIVPYYIFEIYYFNNDFDKIINEAPNYLNADNKLYYHKDLNLLLGKVYYEKKDYEKALPYYKYYYDNSDKIRKENLYEYAFANYSLGHFNQAIDFFKPLSNNNDSLGQNSMYLLGDSYLKIQDKPGAKNAFFLAHDMDWIPGIKESAHFLYAKLAYDLGDNAAAAQSFNEYINLYPRSQNRAEAQEHLVTLLSMSNNYEQAYEILKEMDIKGQRLESIYQSVTLARALQILKSSQQKESALALLTESLKYPVNKDQQAAAYFWRSYVMYDTKDYQQSERDIKEYFNIVKSNDKGVTKISREASIKNAHTHLGYVQMALEKYSDAQQSFAASGQMSSSQSEADNAGLNTVLQADAAFMSKNYSEADRLYAKAQNEKYADGSYILYQRGLIAGINGEHDDKINLLTKLLRDYPNSDYAHAAQYELALTYNVTNQYDAAIPLLKELVKNEDKALAGRSLFLLADVYQKKNDYKNAIETYETLIKSYPNHPNKEQYLETLYAIYITKRDPKGYQDFITNNKIETSKNYSEEQGIFDIAEGQYLNDDYLGAIESFKKFQADYPQSNLVLQADYYLAQSYSKVFKFTDAKTHYLKLIESSDEGLKTLALMNLAKIDNINGQYESSLMYLDRYFTEEARANSDKELLFLELKNLSFLELFQRYEAPLDILEDKNNLTSEEQDWLKLYSTNSDMYYNPNAQLLNDYDALINNKNGEIAAEARIRKAQLLLKLNRLDEAEKACDIAIDKNNDYNFWLVKSYIVIAQVLSEQKDYVSARATIQSVINNVKDPILKSQAENVLNDLNEKEKLDSNIIED